MDYVVINAGAFAGNDISAILARAAKMRTAALDKCYSMAGYEALPLEEKNAIYDRICKEIELDF